MHAEMWTLSFPAAQVYHEVKGS